MKQARVKILKNEMVTGKYFKLSFKSPWPAEDLKPGQFLEIRVSDGLESFLRKPLGIHSVKGKAIEVLYEAVGNGTGILSKKRSGETLDIIGPLGNGFEYGLPVSRLTGSPVLVAGGIGVAPLVFLAQRLKCHSEGAKRPKNLKILRPCGAQDDISKPLVLIGARTKKDLLCEKEFKNLGCDVRIATDDGSKGHKGFVTDLLKDILREPITEYRTPTIYACGPKPMLKATAGIAARNKIPCQALLEEYMACGLGVCLGCPVKTRGGYKMVCKDGPVFEASEIIWE